MEHPTTATRVGSFSNFGGSLPPQDPYSIGLRWGPAILIFTKIAGESDAGKPEQFRNLALDTGSYESRFESKLLNHSELQFPHLCSGDKDKFVPKECVQVKHLASVLACSRCQKNVGTQQMWTARSSRQGSLCGNNPR